MSVRHPLDGCSDLAQRARTPRAPGPEAGSCPESNIHRMPVHLWLIRLRCASGERTRSQAPNPGSHTVNPWLGKAAGAEFWYIQRVLLPAFVENHSLMYSFGRLGLVLFSLKEESFSTRCMTSEHTKGKIAFKIYQMFVLQRWSNDNILGEIQKIQCKLNPKCLSLATEAPFLRPLYTGGLTPDGRPPHSPGMAC